MLYYIRIIEDNQGELYMSDINSEAQGRDAITQAFDNYYKAEPIEYYGSL